MDEIKFNYDSSFTNVYLLGEEDSLSSLGDKVFNSESFFFIDDSIPKVLLEEIVQFHNHKLLSVDEELKTIETVEHLWEEMFNAGISKKSHLIGVGGGVLTDLIGFAASTFKRGIDFSFIPTTLLGMVDASHGGKNGINTLHGKNQVGLINTPKNVVCDMSFIETLSKDELRNGTMEIIKSGYIQDESIYEEIIDKRSINPSRDLILKAIEVKKQFVEADLYESQERMKLNFGHTLGHVIEIDSMYKISHGEAISLGMLASLKLSNKYYGLDIAYFNQLQELLESWRLPTEYQYKNNKAKLVEYLFSDKKSSYKKELNFVLLTSIGNPVIHQFSDNDAEEILYCLGK
jgi:3-dehydroquinate synthase